jgi:excisionase family DNA binding protein
MGAPLTSATTSRALSPILARLRCAALPCMAHASSPTRTTALQGAQLLTAVEVADLLGLTPRTVKQLAHDGRLPRVVLGRRSTRYRLGDVLTLIDDCTRSESPAATAELSRRTSSAPAHDAA